MSKVLLFIFLQVHSIFGNQFFGCMTPKKFHEKIKIYFSPEIQEVAEVKGLLKTLEEQSTEVGYGGFGLVKSIDGVNEKFVIKIQHPIKFFDIISVQKEIKLLKQICGKNPKKVLEDFIDCFGTEIAPFRGCVETKGTVYIFQRRAHSSLDDIDFLNKYASLEPMSRVAVFLKILDLVVRLHKRKIIHSDIKPGNIVTLDSELEEFKLIDLGLAGVEKSSLNGGTKYFFPPEISPVFPSRKLAPQFDVYSLAITFMFLEIDFEKYLRTIHPSCFKRELTSNCHKIILEAVHEVFLLDKDLAALEPIILTALAFNKEDRYATVEDFSKEIVKNLDKIPRYECYFNEIRIKEEKIAQQKAQQDLLNPPCPQDLENPEPPAQYYKWMDYAKTVDYIAKLLNTLQEESQPSFCSVKAKAIPDDQANQIQQQLDPIKEEEDESIQPKYLSSSLSDHTEVSEFADEEIDGIIFEEVSDQEVQKTNEQAPEPHKTSNEKLSSWQSIEHQNQSTGDISENEFEQLFI